MRKIAQIVAAAALIGAGSASVFAAQVNDGFNVTVTVNANCKVTAGDVDFGAIDEVLGTETATGAVSVRCSKGTPFTLSFAAVGSTTSVTGNLAGAIVGNTDTVPYSLGLSGTGGTGTGLGIPQAISFTINGALPTATPVLTPDTYSAARTLYVNY